MSEERRKILEMLSEGKITEAEAEKLLAAVGDEPASRDSAPSGKTPCQYLHIQVGPGPNCEPKDRVNIRVPMKLIRAGLKFAAFIPRHTQGKVAEALKEKGVDVDLAKITPQDLEAVVANLNDVTVEVDGKDTVRIFCV
jgi:hypothetical protein